MSNPQTEEFRPQDVGQQGQRKCTDDPNIPFIVVADDDEEGILLPFQFEARKRGWCCVVARTAREAIAVVNLECSTGRCPDLIITDINFRDKAHTKDPRLTGITAAQSIRDAYGNMPVIFYTGWDNTLVEEQAKPLADPRSGTGEYIVKSKQATTVDGKTIDGSIQAVMDRAEYWIKFWRAARYEGPDRRRRSITRPDLNQGRRLTDRPRKAEVPAPLQEILAQVKQAAS